MTQASRGPDALVDDIIAGLKEIFDPELPVNVFDLGLIYDIRVSPAGDVEVDMTLTSPACMAAQMLPSMVEMQVKATAGVRKVRVQVVWDPPWDPSRLPDHVRLELGFF